MKSYPAQFVPFLERMKAENLPDIFIDNFAYYYQKLVEGDDGMIPDSSIQPVDTLADSDLLPETLTGIGLSALDRTVIIKLNGGLGTGMGLTGPKSLLVVKDGLTFLDIIARQAVGIGAPLLLMNSFVTDEQSLSILANYPNLHGNLRRSFLQHKQPKIAVDNLNPATFPEDRELEWCPPGHGDLYTALVTSGMLDQLLAYGYEYAFVSNADNLGAVLDLSILGHLIERDIPFLMEVADRTPADRKGGHLARHLDGRLILREIAQCPADDMSSFQDIERYRYFNTNNLWLSLPSLKRVLEARNYRLGLPMIRNRKTLDPRDSESPAVFQLETAMGSAIAVFDGADAIRVPRSRFAPVKKTDDLLAVRSDAYVLTDDYRVILAPERAGVPPTVELQAEHYRFVNDLDRHFPAGSPSLRCCDHMQVLGEFEFGSAVVLRGHVKFENPNGKCRIVPDGLVVENENWPPLHSPLIQHTD